MSLNGVGAWKGDGSVVMWHVKKSSLREGRWERRVLAVKYPVQGAKNYAIKCFSVQYLT
eukprot:TRINITY_DN5004_c0_g1_i1.p1 TRINITY_DN5004_c0_g1~~TRINITY_DN5004_c0_g1_i1.p1  ORF type:complete len:59 (-),score=5.07 TRINITY_DN5004_c0_g1_i1:174-350(-)